MDVDFYVDIHAHSTLMNGFMYGNVYDDPVRYEKQAVFPRLMCANAEDFSMVIKISLFFKTICNFYQKFSALNTWPGT